MMSIDEFIAFISDVITDQFDSPATAESHIDSAREAYTQSHNLKSFKARGLDSQSDADFDSLGVVMSLTYDEIKQRYSIDEEKLEKYMEEMQSTEDKNKRKADLQYEIEVVQYDISLINDEISEKKASGAPQEELKELYQELQDMNAKVKKLKKDLYYL